MVGMIASTESVNLSSPTLAFSDVGQSCIPVIQDVSKAFTVPEYVQLGMSNVSSAIGKFCSDIIQGFAKDVSAAPSSPDPRYTCDQFPTGDYQVLAFATYKERQIDPRTKDISNFTVTSAGPNHVSGYVKVNELGPKYLFNASCLAKEFNGFNEVILNIKAPIGARVGNCSMIYNFYKEGTPFGPTGYLGAPSLITGDANYTACPDGRYGTIYQDHLT